MQFKNIMQLIVLACVGIDYFVTAMKIFYFWYEVEIQYINADGFFQFLKHHAFTELLGDQFCPVVNCTFIEVIVFADLHFNIKPAIVFTARFDVEYGHFARPIISQVVRVF